MEGRKINCRSCGKGIDPTGKYCPFCGTTLREAPQYQQQARAPKPASSTWPIIAVLAIAATVVIAAIAFWPGSPLGSPDDGTGGSGSTDSDGDGYNDDVDAFPNDPFEWRDSDNDGHGDNGDEFPNDPSEWRDSDSDGYGDNVDEFPNDPFEWRDSDNDGYGDNGDEFPTNPSEWRDNDSDGIGDNADFYDSGNGGIKLKVTYIAVTQDCDFWTACDPYFKFMVDVNRDGNYEKTKTSSYTSDKNVISNPNDAYFIVDIPDGTSSIKFSILAYDSDTTADERIDYTPGGDFAYVHTISSPFSDSWSYTGSSPSGPYYAQLDYRISVVNMG